MTAILDLIGWPLGLACLAVAVPLAVRTVRNRHQRGDRGNWATILMFTLAATAALAVTGVLSPLAAGIAGGALLAVFAAVAQPWRKGAAGAFARNAAFGGGWLARDAFTIRDRLARWARGVLVKRSGGDGADAIPIEAVAEHAATRAIPSVMEDPHLGAPPEPAELASAAIPVPAPWAALAEYIRSREPEDDQQLRMFSDGDAVGALAVADAYHSWADTCLNGLRLSPAYVAGVLEAGDSAAGHASVIAMVHKRFGVIYGAIKEWIGAHGPLPAKGDFLTEE